MRPVKFGNPSAFQAAIFFVRDSFAFSVCCQSSHNGEQLFSLASRSRETRQGFRGRAKFPRRKSLRSAPGASHRCRWDGAPGSPLGSMPGLVFVVKICLCWGRAKNRPASIGQRPCRPFGAKSRSSPQRLPISHPHASERGRPLYQSRWRRNEAGHPPDPRLLGARVLSALSHILQT